MTPPGNPSRTWLVSLFLVTAACGGQPFSRDPAGAAPNGAGSASTAGSAGGVTAGSGAVAGSGAGAASMDQPGPAPSDPGSGGNGSSPHTEPPLPVTEPNAAGGDTANITDVPGAGGASASSGYELIDDIEGDFPHLPVRDGRNGGWYMVHDDTGGVSTPAKVIDLDLAGTQHAVSISGQGFTGWGVQLAVALKSPAVSYDASSYCGIRFKAGGTGSGWTLLVSDRTSVPEGGVCGQPGGPECYAFVGKHFEVTEAWQDIRINFDELGPLDPNAAPRLLDAGGIYDIIFNFWDDKGGAFALAVDDLSFIERGPNGCP